MNYRLIPMTAEHVPQVAALERTLLLPPMDGGYAPARAVERCRRHRGGGG